VKPVVTGRYLLIKLALVTTDGMMIVQILYVWYVMLDVRSVQEQEILIVQNVPPDLFWKILLVWTVMLNVKLV